MRYTEITYIYKNEEHTETVCEYDYRSGEAAYFEGIVNKIETITQVGATVTKVAQIGRKD